MVSHFRLRPGALQTMCVAPWMEDAMKRRAERIAELCRLFSPYRTGRLYRGWKVSSGRKLGIAYGRVINRVPYARFVNNGTRYMKGQRILERAKAAARF